ncbi:hypothetical protein ABWK22_02415 [Gottfriedia acidiceleris]|uniref:hypothetical protein n=1 Tax=Gottfriedia acidiceleris TaxID=371036 RepID=UPI003396AC1F
MNEKDKLRKETFEFEDGFLDGVYVIPRDPKEPRIKVRALVDYCEKNGKKPEQLTDKELQQFYIYDK